MRKNIDLSAVPSGFRVVGVINLPVHWRRYASRSDAIQKKHPEAKSFGGGTATIFAVDEATADVLSVGKGQEAPITPKA